MSKKAKMTDPYCLDKKPEFLALLAEKERLKNISINELFSEDPNRANEWVIEGAGIELDYSRHAIDKRGMSRLFCIIDAVNGQNFAQELFDGFEVNFTEKRPALHSLFRSKNKENNTEPLAQVSLIKSHMRYWVEKIISGEQQGVTGEPITDVVNLGIGGSDLGPRLVLEALHDYRNHINCHFVSNLDPDDLNATISQLSPGRTLFVICSKSFTTEETLINAKNARDWLFKSGISDLENNFVAITENTKGARDFGIPAQNCLYLPEWVGGRYSVWSSAGLTCALGIGWESFCEFLSGAEAMDRHFESTPDKRNLPILLSLLELWYCNFRDSQVHAIIPYCHSLRNLSSYLQQLMMESNGKTTLESGEFSRQKTAPIIWGGDGISGEHSFFQLLHQGKVLCPIDFILPLSSISGEFSQHAKLVSHCLAQARALMIGRSAEQSYNSLIDRGFSKKTSVELANHLSMPGNRPSSIISFKSLTPSALGALIALYEHKTYFSARLWGVNAFDQWGVETGKEMSAKIQDIMLKKNGAKDIDSATLRLIDKWKRTTKEN